jgi:hypothetical protein
MHMLAANRGVAYGLSHIAGPKLNWYKLFLNGIKKE